MLKMQLIAIVLSAAISFVSCLCRILEKHKGTFRHIENKKVPAHLDWFGWCTWDAFYTGLNPRGIKEGLQSFSEGGCSPKFLIIDDGWQDTVNEFRKEGEPLIKGTQFASRLVDIKENSKFKSSESDGGCSDLHEFVNTIKENFGLKGNRSYKPNPRLARVLDILFILHAEHEMNCSTAAARHLASG